LNPDGTYQTTTLIVTSTVTGDEEIQKGTFALNGAIIAFTPTEASCAAVGTPGLFSYAFNGTNIELTDTSGTQTTFARTASAAPGPPGLTLVVGCGTPFAPEPMTGSAPTGSDVVGPSVFGSYVSVNSARTVYAEVTLNPDLTYQYTM
jgi:hypothetical protein